MIIEKLAQFYSGRFKLPRAAQIAVTNRCNFNCPMCQRNDLKVGIKDIDLFLFEKILAKLDGVKNIILTGWGEPTVHPDLFAMIKMCKTKGMDVFLTSNGSTLTDEKINAIFDSGLDAITFSVDEIDPAADSIGHPNANQIANIKKLLRMKKELNTPLKVFLQAVYGVENENAIMQIVDFGIENKADRIRLTRLDTRFRDFKRPTVADEKNLVKKILKKLKGTGVGLDFLPHVASEGKARFVFNVYKYMFGFADYCLRALGDVYINEDAKVTPCCALPNLVMGDIKNEELGAIWHGEKFKEFRKNQRKYCGKCDVLSLNPHGNEKTEKPIASFVSLPRNEKT